MQVSSLAVRAAFSTVALSTLYFNALEWMALEILIETTHSSSIESPLRSAVL